MICIICNKKIIEEEDRWVQLKDYNCGKLEGETLSHLKCWKNKDEEFDKRCKEKVGKSIKQAMQMIKKLSGNKKEEYVLT